MSMKVSFEISERDLKHFRREMKKARDAVRIADDEDIIFAAEEILSEVKGGPVPHFVAERLLKLEMLIAMVRDEEWALSQKERAKVLCALAYFSDPDDLIPDHIPGLGFLDDAIMVELVLREMKHEIAAYIDFCEFRDSYYKRFKIGTDRQTRETRLMQKREALLERMQRRRQKDREESDKPSPLW